MSVDVTSSSNVVTIWSTGSTASIVGLQESGQQLQLQSDVHVAADQLTLTLSLYHHFPPHTGLILLFPPTSASLRPSNQLATSLVSLTQCNGIHEAASAWQNLCQMVSDHIKTSPTGDVSAEGNDVSLTFKQFAVIAWTQLLSAVSQLIHLAHRLKPLPRFI